MAALIHHWFSRLPVSTGTAHFLSHSAALPVAFLLLAYLQIVLGELCPKSVALTHPEYLARVLGPPSLTIAKLLNPFIWVLNQSTLLLLSLIGLKESTPSAYERVTPEELRLLITTSTEIPDLENEDREILNNVFEFREATVEEVMVPRTLIAALPSSATFQDLLDEMVSSGHSRYPITGESLDDVLGIINFNNLAAPLCEGKLTPKTPIMTWVTPARVVPETLPLSELRTQMQQSAREMVIAVDEYGGTAGLVTFRDLAAEIIGDVGRDDSRAQISTKDSHTVVFPAQIALEDVNERLSLSLPANDDYLTLGGFLIYEMQKIPSVGERFLYEDLELTVLATEGPKLTKIQIKRLGKALTLRKSGMPAALVKPPGRSH